MGNSAANGSTGSRDDESAGKLVVGAAAEIGRSVLRWLAPLLVLGGVGMAMVNAGSSESTGAFGQANTDLSGVGIAGVGFLALAVGVFFGRGSFAGLLDVHFFETSLISSRVDMFTLSADCWNPS